METQEGSGLELERGRRRWRRLVSTISERVYWGQLLNSIRNNPIRMRFWAGPTRSLFRYSSYPRQGHASLKSDFNGMVQLGGQNVGQMVLGIGGSGVGRDLHL
ncbi:hypothetical protein FF1_020651 [Malus domestica]